MSIEKIKLVVEKSNLDKAINDLKLYLNNDNLQDHEVVIQDDNIIVNIFYKDDVYFSPSYRVFGKIRLDKIYFGRVQYIGGMYDTIDVYYEFHSKGEILGF